MDRFSKAYTRRKSTSEKEVEKFISFYRFNSIFAPE